MQPRRKHRRGLIGVLLGAAVTIIVAAFYVSGRSGPVDRFDLDFGFKHYNRVTPDPRIVLIDINDFALEKIHVWPWPRRMQADLIRVLHECGASAILLDIVYSEPSPASLDDPRLAPGHELEADGEVLGELSLDAAVYHDEELAAAMAEAGNVYAGMFFQLAPPRRGLHALRERARKLIDAEPGMGRDTLASRLGITDPRAADRVFIHSRMDRLLRQKFTLSAADLARELNLSPEAAARELDDVKEASARWLVSRALADHPAASFAEIYTIIVPGAAPEVETPDRAELKRAYSFALSSRSVYARPALEGDVSTIIAAARDETLPIPGVASSARRIGFVSFDKDSDGVLRHVPPLAMVGDCEVPQLGFAVACDVLGLKRADVLRDYPARLGVYDAEKLVRTMPLTPRGSLLLNWHINHSNRQWEGSFKHLPVAQVMEVALDRRSIAENEARVRLHHADAAALMFEGAEAAYLDYEQNVRRLREIERKHDVSSNGELTALREKIAAIDKQALARVGELHTQMQGLVPQDENETALFARVGKLHELILNGFDERVATQNQGLRERIDARLQSLKGQLDGKICLVGYTASAVADMVNTPVFASMPGVIAHANMINTMLTGRFPRVASMPVQTALILVVGLVTALFAGTRGPWVALLAMLLASAALVGSAALAMRLWAVHFGSFLPAIGAFATWAMVTLFRQLTEQRQRRSLARALSRTTSPAIATRITEQLEDFDLPPQPAQVTCYFSDLEGFTTLCEELGVERTQTILNTYLAAMGEVLVGYRGFNKFMGDGIFAFLNAPLWPVEEHAVAGCEAALTTQGRLAQLKGAADPETAAAFRDIRMRVGLHTGPVFVGYFGSAHQSDYTCIGDTVNLAARLESANKAFGTQIMVSGACREAVGERYVFRDLGKLQVKGKTATTPVFELLGRKGEVSAEQVGYAEQFAVAVAEFSRRHWEAARAAFQHCGTANPQDRAVELYLAAIEQFAADPEAAGSTPALQLTTK